MNVGSRTYISVLTGVLILSNPPNAWAYVDPGTGSYLFQVGIASLVATAYTIRRYWASMKTALLPKPGRSGLPGGGNGNGTRNLER